MKSYIAVCVLLGVAFASALPWDREETRSGSVSGTTCNCGWVNRGRIVGGKETKKNEYPLIVALEKSSSNFAFCGGSIITPWHVLTAAHCTINKRPSEILVNVGHHHKWDSPGRRIGVAKIMEHERYDDDALVNDISLLLTSEQIQFNQNVGPACMPTQRLNLLGKTIKALGWGKTEEGTASTALKEVDLKVIDFKRCYEDWVENDETPREATNMCTYEVNKDTCNGDSGGPLIWLDPSTHRYTLVALVSYGGRTCGGNQAAVNTDVTAYASWVHSKIASSKPGVKACTKV